MCNFFFFVLVLISMFIIVGEFGIIYQVFLMKKFVVYISCGYYVEFFYFEKKIIYGSIIIIWNDFFEFKDEDWCGIMVYDEVIEIFDGGFKVYNKDKYFYCGIYFVKEKDVGEIFDNGLIIIVDECFCKVIFVKDF